MTSNPPPPKEGQAQTDKMPTIREAIIAVEAAHFRTVTDTGANSNALVVWNALRKQFGLPWLSEESLAAYIEEEDAYIEPGGSKLAKNLPDFTASHSSLLASHERLKQALASIPPCNVAMDASFVFQTTGSKWCEWMDKRNEALSLAHSVNNG